GQQEVPGERAGEEGGAAVGGKEDGVGARGGRPAAEVQQPAPGHQERRGEEETERRRSPHPALPCALSPSPVALHPTCRSAWYDERTSGPLSTCAIPFASPTAL